jgi:queuine tRNA-ribosyltransferase
MPTRNARNGMLFTANGRLTKKKMEDDFSPLMIWSLMWIQNTLKAYLRHLFAANEYLGNKLLHHNLGFIWLVREARKHILAGDFRPWKEMMVKNMNQRL